LNKTCVGTDFEWTSLAVHSRLIDRTIIAPIVDVYLDDPIIPQLNGAIVGRSYWRHLLKRPQICLGTINLRAHVPPRTGTVSDRAASPSGAGAGSCALTVMDTPTHREVIDITVVDNLIQHPVASWPVISSAASAGARRPVRRRIKEDGSDVGILNLTQAIPRVAVGIGEVCR
jgi:hypothetical protein